MKACQMLDYIEYLADILTVGNLEERAGAFLFTILAREKETHEHATPARRKRQEMEL